MIQILAVAGTLLAALPAHAATFDVPPDNVSRLLERAPDTAGDSSHFSTFPSSVGFRQYTITTTLQSTFLTALTNELGALGAGESYQKWLTSWTERDITIWQIRYDPRITCVTPSVGGPGFRYQDWWGVPGSGRSTGTAYLQDYNQTVAAEVYWPDITCPTLYLEASNDFNAPFDAVIQSMALQSTNVPQQLAFTPHKNHQFDTDAYAARVLWQKTHLTDGFDFPDRSVAQLDLMQENGVPVFRVWPDESTSNTVVSVDIYYGIDRQILSRFWRDAQAVEINGHWEAPCPVFDLDEMMVVLAVVTYDCGFDLAMSAGYSSPTQTFSVASEVSLVYPPELENRGVVATAEKSSPDRRLLARIPRLVLALGWRFELATDDPEGDRSFLARTGRRGSGAGRGHHHRRKYPGHHAEHDGVECYQCQHLYRVGGTAARR